MPRLFMAIRREDQRPIIDIMSQMPEIPATCQWALFLRNHDELTLEMVTDEERDYMYAEYARDPRMRLNLGIRRRLAPLMDNGRRQIELMHSLLFTLPGSPVLYYGDEIGMGDNIHLGDRSGVRTPMQWTGDRNAGFSRANPSALYQPIILDPIYHYQAVNVEAQLQSPTSLLNWLRRLIRVRREHKVFGRGSLEFIPCRNRHVVAYVRAYQDQIALVVNNLSRFSQPVELDLSRYQGMALDRDRRQCSVPHRSANSLPDHAGAARLLLVPPGEASVVSRHRSDLVQAVRYPAIRFGIARRLGVSTGPDPSQPRQELTDLLGTLEPVARGGRSARIDADRDRIVEGGEGILVGHVVTHHDRQRPASTEPIANPDARHGPCPRRPAGESHGPSCLP